MNQYGTQTLSPNFLEQGLLKHLDQPRSSLMQLLQTPKKFFDTDPNQGPSVPF